MSSQYQPTAEIVVEELDDDGLCLYRPSDDQVLILNSTAADIWRLAEGASDSDQICRRVADRYGLEPARVEAHVQQALAEFTAKGYLRAVDAAGTD